MTPGERVAFVSANQRKGGTWAEFAVVSGNSLILPIPEAMSFESAAAVPVAGNTTLRALHALGPLPRGAAVFVAGASGAIGSFAIPLAVERGWRVAASASPRNHDYLRSLGADLAVDYHDPDWPAAVRAWSPGGVRGALAMQPGTTETSASVVADHGVVVTVSGDSPVAQQRVRVTGLAYHVDVTSEVIDLMTRLHEGLIPLEIEHVYPFDETLAALAKVGTRRARGKIVISLG